MGVVGGHHFDRRHIRLFFEQLTEVCVGGTSLEVLLAALFRVVGLHDLLADITAAGHVVGAFSPGWIADESPDSVPDLVLAPFQVIGPILLDVAYGNDLHVWAGEYSADFPDGLSAEADAGECDLLAGRDKSRPAEHVSRHDGKRGGGRPSRLH